jgi:hypothetical protein
MAMYEGSADAKFMSKFYREYLVPTANKHLKIGKCTRWLLHDNDARHKSPAVRKILHDNSIEVLDFPPYSPRADGFQASSRKPWIVVGVQETIVVCMVSGLWTWRRPNGWLALC